MTHTVKIVPHNSEEHLRGFVETAQSLRKSGDWRCLYVKLAIERVDKESLRETIKERIISSFDKTDDVYAFLISSGHCFIFFRGSVRGTIKNFEELLSFISADKKREEYHFFWELSDFWGYFDQVLSVATDKSNVEPPFIITEEARRQRQARYKPLLLLVEDDRITRHFLQTMLEKYCDIVVAWHAAQAQELYLSMLPNITLLDINLPDGDGKDLAKTFCSKDEDAFVVMVSSLLSDDTIKQCIAAGAKAALEKPVKEQSLLSQINKYNQMRQQSEIKDRRSF